MVPAALSVLWATAAFAQKAPAPQPQAKPGLTTATGQVTPLAVDTFDGRVEPVDGTDDRTHLAYELRLTNITAANLTIERVRVLDPSSGGRVVDELSGDKLASRIVVFGGVPDEQFGPGVSAFLFMDVTFARNAQLPKRLEYRFGVCKIKVSLLLISFQDSCLPVAELREDLFVVLPDLGDGVHDRLRAGEGGGGKEPAQRTHRRAELAPAVSGL